MEVGEVNCAADTDPQLGYSSVFGLFLILVAGAIAAVVLLALELLTRLIRPRKKAGIITSLPQLVHLSEREKLLAELARMRKKVQEQRELIARLTQKSNEGEGEIMPPNVHIVNEDENEFEDISSYQS